MAESKTNKPKTSAAKPAAAKPAAKSGATKPATKPAAKPAARSGAAKPAASKTAPKSATVKATKPATKAAPAKTAAKTAPKPAAAKPKAAPAKPKAGAAAAHDENTLHKKLRLRPEDRGLVIAPPTTDDPLKPLPAGFSVVKGLNKLAASEGQFDYIHVFARDRAELVPALRLLHEKLGEGGYLWISWMKMSSKHRGGDRGQATDLNDVVIRRLGLMNGFVDIKTATLDRDWSALLLVHRKR